jgi:DNA-binding transcriptional ArsR family regulator
MNLAVDCGLGRTLSNMLNYSSPLDRIFQALADGTRRGIVERLTAGPASVSELAKPFDMSLPAVLQHVQVLADCGLVRSEKLGRVRICRLEASALRSAEGWVGQQRAAWEVRLDRLDDYLGEDRSHDDDGVRS